MNTGQTHIFNEDVFRSVLARERRRSDRSNLPLVVLIARVDSEVAEVSPPVWPLVADALSAARRSSDLVGWFTPGVAMGLIQPGISGSVAAAARDTALRVRAGLAGRLNGHGVDRVALELHVHPEAASAESAGLRPVEPLVAESGAERPRARTQRTLKRALDVVGSATLLLLFSPVFLLVAPLVKFRSPGPVFLRQPRIGEKGKPFCMLKFRTMHVNVDEKLHQEYTRWFIRKSSKECGADTNTVFKLTNDPRVTVMGNFLRKSSLDELPQLWNVLRGEMSLVGPRPPLQYEVDEYKPWHCRRLLEARPGITGLWQVTGRSRTTFDEMVRLDLRYARTHSLWTDIKILLATPRAVISGKGAV